MSLPTLVLNQDQYKKALILGLVIGCTGLVLAIPASRNKLWDFGGAIKRVFLVGKPLEAETESMSREDEFAQQTLARVKELTEELEKKVLQQEKKLEKQKVEMASLREQYQAAVREVGTTNDLLAKQQAEWLAALKRAEAGTAAYLSEIKDSRTLSPPPATPRMVSGKVNLNTASVGELDQLPGIGPTYAQRIIDYREEQGPFRSLEDLLKVKGIGVSIISKIRDQVEI